MKSLLGGAALIFTCMMVGCSSPEQKTMVKADTPKEVMKPVKKKITYPKALDYVFTAHGGMDAWNSMNTLSYDMIKPEYSEHQVIDLQSRKVKIEQDKFTIGFDGQEVWVEQKDTNTFKGDARFYHNLYFYFFAMPFVLGDEGIQYGEAEPLQIDGHAYPGIKISYKDGVGDSSEDNYFLYYNPKTYETEWLGYTVTYFDGKPSQDIHYLKFEKWKKTEGILLPEVLTWYNLNLEKGEKTSRGTMEFKAVELSKNVNPDAFYAKSKM